MRGRVILVGILCLLSSLPAFPQCTWTPRASAQFRTTALDVAIRGDFAVVATGYGISLLGAETLEVHDAVALPGSTRVVFADGRGIFWVGSGSRLYAVTHDGDELQVGASVDAGGTVNDIQASGDRYLFVATSNGVTLFDALQETNPVRVGTTLATTGTNTTSLAIATGKLYVADNDTSVDIFTISTPSLPQRTGALESLSRAASVHTAGDLVYVSDAFGQNTDVFSGSTRIARLPTGTNAFAPLTDGIHFTAANDRTLRVVDFGSTQTLKELYEFQLAPSGGSDNAIREIERAGNRLYAAAGDLGLAVFDIGALSAPFPVASYRTSATTSTVALGGRAWFADGTGTVSEQKIDPSGLALTLERSWDGGTAVHDADGTRLLTSRGPNASIWSLGGATPSKMGESTFAANVKAATFHGEQVVALLDNGTVWIGGPAPQRVALPPIAFLARGGSQWVFAELQSEARSTVLHHYTTADFSQPAVKRTYSGIAIGMAMNESQVALFTFEGLKVDGLSTPGGTTLPVPFIPVDFAFAGNDLLVADERMLWVYENGRNLIRQHALPAEAIAVSGDQNVAAVATTEGVLAALYRNATPPPPEVAFTNTYYSKVVAGGDRAYLFASDGIDIFSTAVGDLPRYMAGVSAAGVVDIAALPDAFFTLSANGTVTAWSTHGVRLNGMAIDEGPDVKPLSIDVAGNAVWVSLSKGCLTGGCQNKTLVLDPVSLAVTSSMTGAVLDVAAAGNRAYGLFEFPSEIRVLDITDPTQPAQRLATNAPSRATSLAAWQGRVYVLGDRLYEYAENTLLQKAIHFPPVSPDKAQRIHVDGNCVLITSRGINPETYNAETLVPAPPQHSVPAPERSVAILPGRVLLLTTHSLEVWRSGPSGNHKRRATR